MGKNIIIPVLKPRPSSTYGGALRRYGKPIELSEREVRNGVQWSVRMVRT